MLFGMPLDAKMDKKQLLRKTVYQKILAEESRLRAEDRARFFDRLNHPTAVG